MLSLDHQVRDRLAIDYTTLSVGDKTNVVIHRCNFFGHYARQATI